VRRTKASALPISFWLSRASPAKFSSFASISVSKVCNRDVSAAHDLRSSQSRSAGTSDRGKLLGVVHVFVSCQSAIDGLPQQVRKGEPRILCPSVRQVPVDEFAETQSFVQLPHQNQTSIGRDLRSLEATFREALNEKVASAVPHVQQVVNELQVKDQKAASSQ